VASSLIEKIVFLSRAWKYRIGYDAKEIEYILNHVSEGERVVDIGAHKGAYLHWMRKAVGKTGEVLAFEPQPSLAEYLKKIIGIFGYENVTIEWMGLGSEKGMFELVVPSPVGTTSPGAHIQRPGETVGRHSFSVRVDRLDDYLSADGDGPISFIKCDVEGSELGVFKGATRILKHDQPLLLFECEARHLADGDMDAVFSYLVHLGYSGFFFCEDELLPISRFSLEQHQPDFRKGMKRSEYRNNFLFLPKRATG